MYVLDIKLYQIDADMLPLILCVAFKLLIMSLNRHNSILVFRFPFYFYSFMAHQERLRRDGHRDPGTW